MYRGARDAIRLEEPWRDGTYFTAEGQRRRIERTAAEESVRAFHIVRDGAIVGSIVLEDIVRDMRSSASMGFWVAPAARRSGVATEAVRLAVAHAFEALRLHTVIATIDVENIASQRTVERNGLTAVGVLHDYAFINGRWRDHLLYERLAPERRQGATASSGSGTALPDS